MLFAFALKVQMSSLAYMSLLEAFIAGLIIPVLFAVTRKWKCPVSSLTFEILTC